MCNHINLFAAGLAHNGLDTSAQLLGALLDRRGAVVLAVIDGRTVSLKLARYASPVADMLEIAENTPCTIRIGYFVRQTSRL